MPNDRMLQMGSFTATLYSVYLYDQVSSSDARLTIVFWALASIAAIVTIRASTLLIVFVVSLLAGLGYALGYALVMSRDVSLIYFPQILTMCTGSAWVLGILRGSNRFSFPEQFHIWIHRGFLAVSFTWAVSSIQTISAGLIVDTREVTGFSYLTTSDLFALFCIASLSRKQIGKIEFFLFLTVGLLTVTLLGSRSAMAMLAATSIIIFARRFSLKSKLVSLILTLPAALYALTEYVDFQSPAFNRLQSLFNLGSDASLSYRSQLFSHFFDKLDTNPLCFLVSCHAPRGNYAHNFLSVIEHFGAIGLLLFGSISFAVVMRWRFVIRSDFFPLFLFATISLIFTRAWVSPVFPIYLGIALFVALQRDPSRRVSQVVSTSYQYAPKAFQREKLIGRKRQDISEIPSLSV